MLQHKCLWGKKMKMKNGTYVKVMMLQKSKTKAFLDKPILAPDLTELKSDKIKPRNKETLKSVFPQKLPTLLPKTTLKEKKGPENTIVVLPATPYLFPQRPLLLPTIPPAFVLVDPTLQTLNKSPFPVVNRNNGDVTKTTMVNILPIAAYSRPLSAKTKKCNTKSKFDTSKRSFKKSKQSIKSKESTNNHPDPVNKTYDNSIEKLEENIKLNANNCDPQLSKNGKSKKITDTDKNTGDDVSVEINRTVTTSPCKVDDKVPSEQNSDVPKVISTTKVSENEKILHLPRSSNATSKAIDEKIKPKIGLEKEPKDKEHNLPNILDTALCENAVDAGNARLELAEEFLAASPTAAFLMSFPLVSGNRADSPAEEPQNAMPVSSKDTNQRRTDIVQQNIPYFEKPSIEDVKLKPSSKNHIPSNNNTINKQNEQHKYNTESSTSSKQNETKVSNSAVLTNVSNDNPFLNLQMPTLISSTSCTLPDSTFGLDFDCNINKSMPMTTSYASNSNIFYKSDPFSTVKSTIYSTSNISSGHEFNSFGLYPCAMEKYTSKSKSDYSNVEDNLMKIGSSRLTYDIDLGWSHKGFDFVNCTSAPNNFTKDSILTPVTGPYSTSYNPFNPEFHVPLVTSSTKKENTSKTNTSFADTITSFYSQPTNLWSEEVPFYSNDVSKSLTNKQQNYQSINTAQNSHKPNITKQFESKQISGITADNVIKSSQGGVGEQLPDKYPKKSQNKMHINWMTSEIRPMQNNCIPSHTVTKETHRTAYSQIEHAKKQDNNDGNYFPISMLNFPTQSAQEELQVWPSTRPAGTTEISIEPPPINLPTLVGDLALGPHEKKKNIESNRGSSQSDIQNCSNFFSVTQLMNRSTDNNILSRFHGPNIETPKSGPVKHNVGHGNNETNHKTSSRVDSQALSQPCYVFNDAKSGSSAVNYEIMNQYPQSKSKSNKPDKSSKSQKHSYSAEALIRSGCTQKLTDNNAKFMVPPQKYNDINTQQESAVAQVSHFPAILDYTDSTFTGQQFSGTNLYNSTTNTISNSFYSNFIPTTSNLMTGNYTNGPFTGDFIDYSQQGECNYTNHKYEDLKFRNNATFYQDKVPSNYKSSRRESAVKHKLECTKKDSSKKYQSKRSKLNNEVEEWSDTSHLLWQNKTPTKRHSNLMSEEIPFPNYVGNQMPTQYQPDLFNSHIMSSNMQSVGHNVDRTIGSFPVTSRANFNLSTIFPEITMFQKVQ